MIYIISRKNQKQIKIINSMRQKREIFQKQIRRQAINQVFKNNRRKFFNYTYNEQPSNRNLSDFYIECESQFTRYIEEFDEAFLQQNQMNICATTRESYYALKKLLVKAKISPQCLIFVVKKWLQFGFHQRLFNVANLFQQINRNSYSSLRKQVHKYAVSQFYLIFQYQGVIQKDKLESENYQRFLFSCLVELDSETDSIQEILVLLISLMNFNVKTRHRFCFYNRWSKEENKPKAISFQNICYVMFYNREKLKQFNSSQQRDKCHELKMTFIELFRLYCYELQRMAKYLEAQAKTPNQNNQEDQTIVYKQTLQMAKNPDKIRLKDFLSKQTIIIVIQVINQMRSFNLQHWALNKQYEQNLTDCLEAFKYLIDFYPKARIIREFEEELKTLLDLLISRQLNITVKNEIINLLDSIVFVDEDDIITNYLVTSHNMFEKIWSYEEPSSFSVKLNIVNNLLLSASGFKAVTNRLSEVFIALYQTKFVSLALTFCMNFFIRTNFEIGPSPRFDLLIQIIYSLPEEKFEEEDIEKDFYIFSHLYDSGFDKRLPERYEIWKARLQEKNITLNLNNNANLVLENNQELIWKMLDLQQEFYNKLTQPDSYMQDQRRQPLFKNVSFLSLDRFE